MRNTRRWFCFVMLIALMAVSAEGARNNGRITVPVMTPFTVRLDKAVSAQTAVNGDEFTATLNEPVQINGMTVIPMNSSAAGLVSKDRQSSVQMELNSVFVNGRSYRISTSPIVFNQKTSFRAGSTVTFHLMLSLNIVR